MDLSLHGLFLVDDRGMVQHINRTGENIMRATKALRISAGKLATSDFASTKILRGLVAAASCGVAGEMAVSAPGRRLPVSLTVTPIPANRFGLISGCTALVCVTDLEAGIVLPEKQLRTLFGLTPAETRLAAALLDGATTAEAAERFGVSINTVHVQLARIFDKTGTKRQTELMRLLMRLAIAGEADPIAAQQFDTTPVAPLRRPRVVQQSMH
ncbi:MAG TPA: helix-turn-helix transcriptional regulator [Rhizomicrobium sp.]